MWYTFKAGGVRVISLNNDDVCLQDGGDTYVRGYSSGAQKRWLERTLQQARDDVDTDWIVVCMHQVSMSSAHNFNGADLGIRQEWLPLFDKYAVDLVLTGHEHHFERTLAVRGTDAANTLRPKVTDTNLELVDTTRGTVHMIIGGGGTSAPSNQLLLDPPRCEVITQIGEQPETPSGGARAKRVQSKRSKTPPGSARATRSTRTASRASTSTRTRQAARRRSTCGSGTPRLRRRARQRCSTSSPCSARAAIPLRSGLGLRCRDVRRRGPVPAAISRYSCVMAGVGSRSSSRRSAARDR